MVQLSATGEIGDFLDVDQFQPAKTQFACGYFSGAIIRAMAQVGQPPTQSVQAAINEAETWYAADHGNNSISNTDGMSLQEEYDLIINKMGLHYQAVSLDVDTIRGWVRAGYPVMLTISETSVFDIALGGNPYTAWRPSGTHIFVVTGVAGDNNFLVRDPANCTSLYNPNSLRPGPRHYTSNMLQIWTATVVVPPWLPRPTSAIPPTGGSMSNVPPGWQDDGQTLTAPNGHKVVLGFRDKVLNSNWDPGNVPLEEEHGQNPLEEFYSQADNVGSQQVFLYTVLCYNQARGVYIQGVGNEFLGLRAEVAQLKAQPPQPPQPALNLSDAISVLQGLGTEVATKLAQALKDLGVS